MEAVTPILEAAIAVAAHLASRAIPIMLVFIVIQMLPEIAISELIPVRYLEVAVLSRMMDKATILKRTIVVPPIATLAMGPV